LHMDAVVDMGDENEKHVFPPGDPDVMGFHRDQPIFHAVWQFRKFVGLHLKGSNQ